MRHQSDSRTIGLSTVFLIILVSLGCNQQIETLESNPFTTKAQLGQALFFDPILSENQTQSCSTCHSPGLAFTDSRVSQIGRAVSLGDDGVSLTDRNSPTLTYASLSPDFALTVKGHWRGGQFMDGRAANMQEQVSGPILSDAEMGMKNKQQVANRVLVNTNYKGALRKIFPSIDLQSPIQVFDALAGSIAEFEKSDLFSPFDSKYDRALKGEITLSKQEELGRTLFFSQQFTNCATCHQLQAFPTSTKETFSNYGYHNIGTPQNETLRALKDTKNREFIDEGLANNLAVDSLKQKGKFKVPSLRNVAITGPYMHNGVFQELRTVIQFYNKYNSKSSHSQINPETAMPWERPEIGENISLKELRQGPALDKRRVDAILAFLETLTDQRYEHLLEN